MSHGQISMNKRKYFVEDTIEISSSQSGGSLETKRTAAKKTNVSRSTDCVSPWWTKEHLPPAEALWASTLKSALPYLNQQHWEPVPDLPRPSAAELDEERRCDLNGEAPPSPQPPPASQQCPDFPATSSQRTETGLDITNTSLSSLVQQERRKSNFATALARSEKDQTSPDAVAGPSRVEKEGRKPDVKQDVENRPTARVVCSDSQPLEKEENIIEERMETEKDGEKKCSDAKSTEGAQETLSSCPMCLLLFPVGASQLERDGHLAQCLSEMNVDMS
ncbi:uncharacterized protein LOC144013285 isoform X2 [Festucalex cinctus]